MLRFSVCSQVNLGSNKKGQECLITQYISGGILKSALIHLLRFTPFRLRLSNQLSDVLAMCRQRREIANGCTTENDNANHTIAQCVFAENKTICSFEIFQKKMALYDANEQMTDYSCFSLFVYVKKFSKKFSWLCGAFLRPLPVVIVS